MRYLTITCLLFLLVGASGASGAAGAAPVVELRVPPFPQDLDLRSVERLYKSAAYKVEVRQHAAKADGDANANINAEADDLKQTFVFETRNDWVMHDYFNKNPDRRRDVLSPAERVGHTADLPAHVNAAKADLQTASFTQFSFANTCSTGRRSAPPRPPSSCTRCCTCATPFLPFSTSATARWPT